MSSLLNNAWGRPNIIFFWTKNPRPMLDNGSIQKIMELGIKMVFQYTINAYPKSIERNIPDLEHRIESYHMLKDMGISVIWRYDPICFGVNSSSKANWEWHGLALRQLAKELHPTKLVFSFVDAYGKVTQKLRQAGLRPPTKDEEIKLAAGIANLSQEYGFIAATCAEAGNFPGIQHNACIDPFLISKLCPEIKSLAKDNSQRKLCGCYKSFDVGEYRKCSHGCVYCYAQ